MANTVVWTGWREKKKLRKVEKVRSDRQVDGWMDGWRD